MAKTVVACTVLVSCLAAFAYMRAQGVSGPTAVEISASAARRLRPGVDA